MPKNQPAGRRFTESVIRRMTRVANACGAINLSQGFPGLRPAGGTAGRAGEGGPGRAPPVRRHLGGAEFPRGPGPQADPVHGPSHRSRRAHRGHLRQHRGDDGRDDDRLQSGRQGHRVLAVLRELRRRHDPVRRGADLRAAAAAGFRVRPRRAAPRLRAAAQGADPVQSVQSHAARCSPARSWCSSPRLAEEFDAFVITDEVYEHIVYAPHRHIYFAALPGMFERTISCSSLSKTYSITGWRLGYVIAPPAVIDGARKVHDFLTVGAAAPLQEAAVAGAGFARRVLRRAAPRATPRSATSSSAACDAAGLTYTGPRAPTT